ncbi:MAG: VOC family protein [Alphaproteobacteria bacterium]|nr:VOC family protein [Alphaproteobacteria bacterium]
MHVAAHLNFSGNCEEAFRYYEKHLGGQILAMVPHEGTPAAEGVSAEWRGKIIHARMRIGSSEILGADSPAGRYEKPKGFSVTLLTESVGEADRAFASLADGGTVQMPIGQTFFSKRFGVVTDRFGIPWMVNCDQPVSS